MMALTGNGSLAVKELKHMLNLKKKKENQD